MIRRIALTISLLAVCSLLYSQNEEFGKWKNLLNGKDTSGWKNVRGKNQDKTPASWTGKDGVLTNGKGHVDDICSAAAATSSTLVDACSIAAATEVVVESISSAPVATKFDWVNIF